MKLAAAGTGHPQHPAVGSHANRKEADLLAADEADVVALFLGA
jgi:hypothetical protein